MQLFAVTLNHLESRTANADISSIKVGEMFSNIKTKLEINCFNAIMYVKHALVKPINCDITLMCRNL